jgi:predicted nucleic acid-binding protein
LTALPVITVYSTDVEEKKALALIAKYKDKDFSMTDAVSFVVMDKLRITTAFAFDRNFEQYGLAVL